MGITRHDLQRLDGGINEGTNPAKIQDNECQNLRNFYPFGTALKRRDGVTKITNTAFGENLTSIFAYRPTGSAWSLILGGLTTFGKLDGTGIVVLPHVDGTVYASDTQPWYMVQLKDIVYAARPSGGTVQRIDGSVVMDAGIVKPLTSASAAEGSAGNLGAGDYQYVVTFVNVATGAESDFNVASTAVTIAADKRVDVTSIPTSLNAQVTGRNIYRTLAGQSGEYFFVAQIADNFATTYEDNVNDDDLTARASLDNGLPPTAAKSCASWNERLWVFDDNSAYFSRAGQPESFSADFQIPIFRNDGHVIRGAAGMSDRLLVGKTNKMHFIAGIDESEFSLHTLSDKHGLYAGHSIQVVEGVAFWFGGDDFYQSDGAKVLSIGKPFVRDTINAFTDAEKERLVSWVFQDLNWYCTSAPTSGLILVANYKTQTWTIFEHGSLGAPVFCGTFADSNYGIIMYAVFEDGHLYQWHTGSSDNGEDITCKARSKEYGYTTEGFLKAFSSVMILSDQVNETLTVRAYKDAGTSAVKTRSVDLSGARKWKRVPISNMRSPGSTVSFEIEYSGSSDFRIDALSFNVASPGRGPRHV